ncbi:helix-turn-helix transcriptional regulator [Aureimonas sp. AU40]|uniref:helix-turn-helix transcriptional regulator n=1 Tax=Aureimonas sp. AU40 TaxID=1637747 RepID=UPI0007807BDA|nr:helix-turn-helix domain-containing protein [Aureimonas sp. AU40]
MSEELLTTQEAAERLRLSVPTLARWRVQGSGPVYIKRGARVFYRPTDLDNFIQASARSQTRGEETHAR